MARVESGVEQVGWVAGMVAPVLLAGFFAIDEGSCSPHQRSTEINALFCPGFTPYRIEDPSRRGEGH